MSFSSLLILLPFAKLVCQSKLNPFYPASLQPSLQSLGSQYADPVPKRRRYHLKKGVEIHADWTLRNTAVSHIPHFLPQSAKVIHTLSEGKSSKFPRSGSLGGPGGKAIECLAKICLIDMTVNIAKAIPSKKRLPIATRCYNYYRCCYIAFIWCLLLEISTSRSSYYHRNLTLNIRRWSGGYLWSSLKASQGLQDLKDQIRIS